MIVLIICSLIVCEIIIKTIHGTILNAYKNKQNGYVYTRNNKQADEHYLISYYYYVVVSLHKKYYTRNIL